MTTVALECADLPNVQRLARWLGLDPVATWYMTHAELAAVVSLACTVTAGART